MKLVYVLLACALVTMNSAFAMFDEEGPFGEDNAVFCLKKETVLKHFDSPQPRDPLIIKGCAYDLRGSITGDTGVHFRKDSSIEWIVFQNYAPSHEKPCKHWSYFLRLCFPNEIDAVNLEIHKAPKEIQKNIKKKSKKVSSSMIK
jgi:hypothetical protein